jgi:hypothetical protein
MGTATGGLSGPAVISQMDKAPSALRPRIGEGLNDMTLDSKVGPTAIVIRDIRATAHLSPDLSAIFRGKKPRK